jgi:glycosyltransferase involved in cell wall biosynthesis
MRILFIHQNFPGQFRHLAPELARCGHDVTALSMVKDAPREWRGVRMVSYRASRGSTPGIHPWVGDIESKTIRGEACFRTCLALRNQGYVPDLVVAHPGWGESLYVREVWPKARLGIYSEFYYQPHGADVGFDPEFPASDPEGDACRLRMKNLNSLLHFDIADAGLSPTRWQAHSFPEPFRSRITVAHDGIDTSVVAPDQAAVYPLPDGRSLSRNDEVVTFVNRNLEPYRGYHIFMRALPEILRSRPKAQVVIVGGDQVSYGARPPKGKSWKEIFASEVRPQVPEEDWARLHFVGKVPYQQFVSLIQVSTVHVYLTYPFVLSWSLLEAMSAGCAIVGSDTPPVQEAIRHGETGRLVGFFDVAGIAGEVCRLLDDPVERSTLGRNARRYAIETYDLQRICLPLQVEWVLSL